MTYKNVIDAIVKTEAKIKMNEFRVDQKAMFEIRMISMIIMIKVSKRLMR